jgi:hypothetical protein
MLSLSQTDDTGGTVMSNLGNRLHNVLHIPVPLRQPYPVSTVGAPSIQSKRDDASSSVVV